MSFLDKAKDVLHRMDDTAGDEAETDRAVDPTANGDPTATTGPGVAQGGPAEEQQLE